MSTAVQTLRGSKIERLRSSPAPQSFVEEEKPLTPLEKFVRLGREITERRKREGLPEEDEITMEEIVAIVKEARAERYAEEQEKKNAAHR
jgi:hypothetical protein